MISAPAFAAVLLAASTAANAIPIWSRFVARDSTPVQVAQGSNFFFDSLHLEDACSPGQIACINSNLAKCSPEANWEVTPCSANTTCLAVPSSDSGVLVQCMKFTDAESALGTDQVAVDFQITSAPMNTATAVASPSTTDSASLTETPSATDSASTTDASSPTDAPTSTDSVTPTDVPTTTTITDSTDPSATCTDDVEGPETTVTEYISVVISPNPTQTGDFLTTTLAPEPAVTGSDAATSAPEPTSTNSASESAPEASATESPSGSAEPSSTCTESQDPAPTETSTDTTANSSSDPAPTDGISSYTDSATPTESASTTQETGLTTTIEPNFSTTVPNNAGTNSPSAGVTPDVSVVGTHVIPAPSPSSRAAKMIRRRR